METLRRAILVFFVSVYAQALHAQCIEVSLSTDEPILCPYEEVTLTATPGFNSYSWYYSFSDSNVDGILYSVGNNELTLNAGEWAVSYWYATTGDGACITPSETVWWDAWVFQSPAISHSAMTTLCPGDSALIENAFQGPVSFQWYYNFEMIQGATGSFFWANQAGMYTLSVAYPECPELWLSSGIGPEFDFFFVQPVALTVEEVDGGNILTLPSGTDPQWFLNGEPIEGADQLSYLATEEGTFYAQITDANGCKAISNEVEVSTLSTSTGKSGAFEIYPNPFTERLTLNTPEATRMRVFDLSGKLFLDHSLKRGVPHNLDLSLLQSGLYFVEVTLADGSRTTAKVVKE